ncbi:scavenger receptor class B member 1-like [Chrysoperla carnea]|uniref:scavenger receptor class B member 1-like n=1 Tax=Chrysoperla carnea TaxID=189513 RepID=UPI001D07E377|nr:scavenger receptor class B member 1-like [Chrysoperla carnea]
MVLYQQQNPRKLLNGFFGGIILSLSFLTFYYHPLKLIIDAKMKLRNGSLSFDLWREPPYTVYLTVYIFNFTNHEAFERGEEHKLKVEEIGPFVYQEFLTNMDPHFYENGTLSYEPSRKLEFLPHLSIGNPEDIVINVPNLPLLGILSALDRSSMFLNLAVNQLTTFLNSQPMLNLTVHEYLWGYDDPLIKLASNVLPSWINFEKLGILDRMFDDGKNIVTINLDASIKPSKNPLLTDVERNRNYGIQLWNGSPGLSHWGYVEVNDTSQITKHPANTRCNMIEGVYDGVIFPKPITHDTVFRVYRKAFCRTLPIVFDREGKSPDGLQAYFFKMREDAFDTPINNHDNECYCRHGRCLPRGLSDITPCYYGIPSANSQPHFYNSDPKLFERIEGLHPNKEDHDISIILHPQLGIPLWAKSRVQTNLVVRDTKYNAKTRPYNNIVLPVFWMQLSIEEIPHWMVLVIKFIEISPYIELTFAILLGIIGLSFIITAVIRSIWIPEITTHPEKPAGRKISSPTHSTLHIDYSPVKIIPIQSKCAYFDRESNC